MQSHDPSSETTGKILNHAAGLGQPGREMVLRRARELADIAGLGRDEPVDQFFSQAAAELRGTANPDEPNDDSGPTADLIASDDVPGESGYAASVNSNAALHGDDETIGEQLYTEGIDEADHDRMVASRREEQREEN